VARAVQDGHPISSVKLLGIHNDVTFSGAVLNKPARDSVVVPYHLAVRCGCCLSEESLDANVLLVMPQVTGPVEADVRAVLTSYLTHWRNERMNE